MAPLPLAAAAAAGAKGAGAAGAAKGAGAAAGAGGRAAASRAGAGGQGGRQSMQQRAQSYAKDEMRDQLLNNDDGKKEEQDSGYGSEYAQDIADESPAVPYQDDKPKDQNAPSDQFADQSTKPYTDMTGKGEQGDNAPKGDKNEKQKPAKQSLQNTGGSKGRGKQMFNCAYIKKHYKIMKKSQAIQASMRTLNIAVSSAITGLCWGIDYVAWATMAIAKPSVLIPSQRFTALFEMTIIDDGVAAVAFGFGREQLDQLLQNVQEQINGIKGVVDTIMKLVEAASNLI